MEVHHEVVTKLLTTYHPEGLRIVTNYSCNRNCKMCYQENRKSIYLDPYQLGSIFRIFQQCNFMPIYITHQGGEITINKYSMDYYKMSNLFYPQVFRKSITSNGTAPYEYYMEALNYGITHLTFSLHSSETPQIEKLIIQISNSTSRASIRVNCYFDEDVIDGVKYVYDFCRKYGIQLTLCEDLRSSEFKESCKIVCDKLKIQQPKYMYFKHQTIVQEKDYSFWIYKHLYEYDYNNIIIMPNGEITMSFNDIIKCKGAE